MTYTAPSWRIRNREENERIMRYIDERYEEVYGETYKEAKSFLIRFPLSGTEIERIATVIAERCAEHEADILEERVNRI